MRFPSIRAPRSLRRLFSTVGLAIGLVSVPAAVALADFYVLFIDIHSPSGAQDYFGNVGLIIDNPAAASGNFTGLYTDGTTSFSYVPSYTGTNADGTNTAWISGSHGFPPSTCDNGTGTCWVAVDSPATSGNQISRMTTGNVIASGGAGTGDVFSPFLGTWTAGATPGTFTVTSLNFGVTDPTGASYWIEGIGSGGTGQSYDIHSATKAGSFYTRVGAANVNLIDGNKGACAGSATAGIVDCATVALLPEINSGALPKAALLLGSLYLLAAMRRKAA